ncbi:uncharacterized protein DES53_101656 [Roseimicrobium gellanilyticum]|uniref:HD domain-containing protein n=1 Tax=Roseimicrobium gellanilyticum TaxID=748857 RepID=A0A366HU98_9BACT|nr:hypothetical protein [Roseimicrobium gellanilyticum]RBP47856.1 uncharacterized protein DES53_101656 [Roseimicrobium gellanilyticum]
MPSPALPFEETLLWQHIASQYQGRLESIHGPAHWKRVRRNGLLLATKTGADPVVVRLFSVFHDSRRTNDGWDHGHGGRGAEFATQLRKEWLGNISDDQFELLHYACTWHTDGHHHHDPTIGTCWDADRLDLGRVSIIPSAEFMSTAFAKEMAAAGSIQPYLPHDDWEMS